MWFYAHWQRRIDGAKQSIKSIIGMAIIALCGVLCVCVQQLIFTQIQTSWELRCQSGKDKEVKTLTGLTCHTLGFHTDSRDRLKPIFATLRLLFQKPLFSNNNKTVLSNNELCSSEIPFKELSCFWKFFCGCWSRNAMTTLQKWQQVPNNLHLRTMIQSSPSGHLTIWSMLFTSLVGLMLCLVGEKRKPTIYLFIHQISPLLALG